MDLKRFFVPNEAEIEHMPLNALVMTLANVRPRANETFGGAQGQVVKLPVPYEHQLLNNWCWAACAAMASNIGKTQCDLGKIVFPGANCPPDPAFDGGADPSQIDRVLRAAGRIPLVSTATPPIGNPGLLFELDQGRPLQIGWIWTVSSWGGGHVVLLVGYEQNMTGTVFLVHDPLPPLQGGKPYIQISENDLMTAQGRGKWTHAWKLR